jgi:hypothetical protein
MSLAALSVLPLRLTRVTFSLFVLALAVLLPPATAPAQTITAGGAINIPAGQTAAGSSTVTVSGAPGPVATVKVTLQGVTSDAQGNDQSMGYAEFLLQSPSGAQFVLLGSTGDGVDGGGLSGVNIVIQDSGAAAPYGNPWSTASPQTVKPSSYFEGNFGTPPPLPTVQNTPDYPQSDGSGTLNGRFNGETANGTWKLYLIDNDTPSDPVAITGWTLALTYSAATPTTATLSSNASNPAFYANSASSISITYTATVSSGSGTPTGTVTFQANGSTISGCGGVALSGGVAHCTIALAQGNNSITAQYTPSGAFGQSSSSIAQLVEVTPANPSGDQWCNNNLLSIPANDNPGLAYPSIIGISDSSYNGKTVGNVTVELEGIQGLSNGINGQFLLVAPGGGAYNLVFLEDGFNPSGATSAVNLTFDDTASETVPYNSGTPTTGNYLPTDNNEDGNLDTFQTSTSPSVDSSVPQVPGTLNFAPPFGSGTTTYTHTNVLTFGEAFDGASANGKWALYTVGPSAVNLNSGWCITLALNTGTATTTTLTPGSNPATTGQPLKFTASVTSGGDPVTAGGTVTFLDNGVAPAGSVSGNNVVALNGSGLATFTTSSLTEGDHAITANYSGVANEDNESFSAVLHQRINTATTATNLNSNTWKYCNPGAVQIQGGTLAGPLTPNPSVISVANLPGTLNTVSLTLNGFSVLTTYGLEELASLVEGPTGAALDFFSNTTQGANGNGQASLGAYTFADSASGLVSAGNTSISPGSYKPTAYLDYLGHPDVFTSSLSGFYNVPSFSYAPSHGSSTFANIFTDGSNANGNWSLFFSSGNANATFGAANGWCVNLTENLPTISVSTSPSGSTFTQGQTGAFTVSVTNNGPGDTGDPTGTHPLTVTDTLGAAFTYSSYSGTNWSCTASGQTVTCMNDAAIAEGGYPELTINVNVPGTSGNGNSVSASGAGASNTATASTSVTIDMAPAFTSSNNTTFTVGTAGSFTVIASGNPAPTFTETGALPSGVTLSTAGLLSGTPAAGTGGSYPITIKAANGTTDATQNFTLTVDQAPAITSAGSTTFSGVTPNSFTVTASGYPASMTFGETGALPSGVTFSTTGILSGMPANGTGGSYPITITASNGISPSATQSFMLSVSNAGTPAPATLISPTQGTTFAGSSLTFTWSPVTGATSYEFILGSTGVGSNNIYWAGQTTATSATPLSLPVNGEKVYARLWTNFYGVWVHVDYTFTAVEPATLTSPTQGKTLGGSSQTFTWTPVAGATGYNLWLGTTGVGTDNFFETRPTTATSATVSNFPANGETIYARLWTIFGGVLTSVDYTFTAAGPATLTSPAQGSAMGGSSQTFTWTTVPGAIYNLWLGTTGVGTDNFFQTRPTTATSATVNNFPANGETIYARLWTSSGNVLSFVDYTFTAAGPATLTSPGQGSTFTSSSQAFTWTTVPGALYNLWLGTTVGTDNIYETRPTTATSVTVNSLPTNGETIYARLWTSSGGVLSSVDYTFTAK